MKKCFTILIFIVLVIGLVSCNTLSTIGKPSDIYDTSAEKDIDECNYVQVYKQYIIRYSDKRIDIVHTNNGALDHVATKVTDADVGKGLIIYNDLLVVSACKSIKTPYGDEGNYITTFRTDITIYDLSSLSTKGYDFAIVKTLSFTGYNVNSKVYDGILYTLSSFRYNEEHTFDTIDDNGKSIRISNTVDTGIYRKYANDTCILAYLSLADLSLASKAIALKGSIKELAVFPYGVYPVFENDQNDTAIVKLDLQLKYIALANIRNKTIPNRYALVDNGEHIMVVATNEKTGTELLVYDNQFQLLSSITGIAAGEKLKSVRFGQDYCYIVTYLQVDPVYKINISDPLHPCIEGVAEVTLFSSYMHIIEDMDLAIGCSSDTLTLFDTSNDTIEVLDTITLPTFALFSQHDPSRLLFHRENNMIIMLHSNINIELLSAFGIDLEDTETFTQERVNMLVEYLLENEGVEQLASNEIKVFDYSSKTLQLIHTLNINFEDNMSVSRCVIIGDYLYFAGDIFIKSYDMQNDFALVKELKLPPLLEE